MADFDLAIIGTGSGNSLVTDDFADKRVAIIESGTFGGTCLNVGCIPTKMLVHVADVATGIRESARFGVDATLDGVRWADIRDRVFGRIDPIAEAGQAYRINGPNTTVFLGHAQFTGPRSLKVSTGEAFTADQIVIATGGRPAIPDLVSAAGVPFHTSDTIMRIDALPERMVILGGGYVAAEFAHIFASLGVAVTVVVRAATMLRQLDSEVSDRFTMLAASQWDVRLGVEPVKLSGDAKEIRLELACGSVVMGDLLLDATGRVPNTDRLALPVGGVQTSTDGRVQVDRHGRTSAPGVWALGDVSSNYQLKHVANHEARVVAHNLAHPDDLREFDHRFVPAAVFSHPQVASVGVTEDEAKALGVDYVVGTEAYRDIAYGWAMEDETGFCKLIADRESGLLIGAHLMGYQASSLIQPLIQAMSFAQPVAGLARGQYWIHPALSEVVENALLKLGLG